MSPVCISVPQRNNLYVNYWYVSGLQKNLSCDYFSSNTNQNMRTNSLQS